ncbi:peptidoglycan DD-metalloendopeptidase family protein [Candidatus Saganbacteria bacterium]|nr:peptidoglycan DD-metalloendopeptidase family protein [Candidatus Saganbacteria bacterium]
MRLCYYSFSMKFFAAIFLLIFISAAAAAAELPEEQKLQEINQKLKQSKQMLLKTREEEQAVMGRLVVINKELKATSNNLQKAQTKIKINEGEISTLAVELNETQQDLNQKENKLRQRIREIYKNSGINYLQLLLGANSMSDFLNRLTFFSKIINYDAALVESVRANVRQVKTKREKLENRTQEIHSLAQEIAEKKESISQQATEKTQLFQSLQQRRKEYEARVAELEKSSQELEGLINKKIAAHRGAKVQSSGIFIWPLQGCLTSPFGYRRHPLWGGRDMHTGQDIAAPYGSPIRAADSGEIIYSGWWDGYGKAIVIDHGNSKTTVYGHMSRLYKNVGETVVKGQVIGLVGSTGYSTGPHLHFEVRIKGKPVNPMPFLK